MTNTIPFSSIYPDGSGAAASSSASAADAQVNTQFPGMPPGATPFHNDMTITAAGTYTIWQPPADRTVVVASVMVSTDTAMRVAVVDGSDIAGSRYADGYFAANGGASPNLVPVPRPSSIAGQAVKVVTASSGNVAVRVSGWLQ